MEAVALSLLWRVSEVKCQVIILIHLISSLCNIGYTYIKRGKVTKICGKYQLLPRWVTNFKNVIECKCLYLSNKMKNIAEYRTV